MEAFISVLIGLVAALAVEFAKKTGMSVSTIYVIASLICGLVWGSIEYFGPIGLTDNIFDFASKVLGSGAIVYSFFKVAKDI